MSKLIFVVDDDSMNRELIEAFMKRGGYSTISAISGTQALAMLDGGPLPDLILLDARLGEPDGFEVCAQLKASDATRAIPVLMLSASNLAADHQKAKAAGADGYYHKPDGWPGLLARVADLTSNR